jgi:hypothetical protein
VCWLDIPLRGLLLGLQKKTNVVLWRSLVIYGNLGKDVRSLYMGIVGTSQAENVAFGG